ncbi:MAG: hypothetical protein WBA39_08520 [Rivularia sp. (in: cyanobacteria)]
MDSTVSGGADGEIRLWQVADSKQILSFRGHNDWVSSVAYSPDGKIIASCSHKECCEIVGFQNWRVLENFKRTY